MMLFCHSCGSENIGAIEGADLEEDEQISECLDCGSRDIWMRCTPPPCPEPEEYEIPAAWTVDTTPPDE